jgi:uracil phosphoribosyltransferase
LYEKYSENFGDMKRVFLLDPMLATGGSASMAIERILAKGVDAKNITFINLISCNEGI